MFARFLAPAPALLIAVLFSTALDAAEKTSKNRTLS